MEFEDDVISRSNVAPTISGTFAILDKEMLIAI